MTDKKTIAELEALLENLGIESTALMARKGVWQAAGFGRKGEGAVGEGETVADALASMIDAWIKSGGAK